MNRQEAHTLLEAMATEITRKLVNSGHNVTEQTKLLRKQLKAIDMAIEALQFQDIMVNNPKSAKPTPEVCKNCKDNDRPHEPASDDLIIKGAKGIQDGLYNIQNGELFQYKAKGGTVRTYPIVEALQDDWIPVSDDTLPKDARPVLVYAWNVHHVVAQYKNMMTSDGEYEDMWVTASAYEAPHRIENVIAWKPLTIPCKESEKNR